MEKKLEIGYQETVQRILGTVRHAAQTIPTFRDSHNGCIRITIVPLCQEADDWLGGLGEFSSNDVCEREFVFKIDPQGSHTIQYVCEDGHVEPVNCYGYSALKTAWTSWKRKFDAAVREKNLGETFSDYQYCQQTQFFTEDNGWSMHDGSVCATITLDNVAFVRLYICVSGAKSNEDEECALAGMLEAQSIFEQYQGAVKINPYIERDRAPLKQRWRNE